MHRTLTVSDINKSDLPAIRPLLAELIAALEDPSAFDLDLAMENCREMLGRPDHALLLVRIGETACGFVHLTTRQSILHDRLTGLIDELVVAREFREQGAGRLLMDAAIGRCRDLGCCEVEVSTEKSNLQAQTFYRRCGFDEEGVLFELHFPSGGTAALPPEDA
jgi:ribosomal protein S18 acetylase RimI-like enzyme